MLFTNSVALALEFIDLPPGTHKPVENININGNLDGSFSDLSYIISSSGATSGIRYRTSAITITIGGHTATIDISSLVGKNNVAGQTGYSQITVTGQDIINNIGQQYASQIHELLKNPAKNVVIGANIQIYNAGTKAVIATITKREDVARIAGSIGFGSQDIRDMQTRWQESAAALTTPFNNPNNNPNNNSGINGFNNSNGPNTGLRPSILVP